MWHHAGEAPSDVNYFPTTTSSVSDPNEVIQDDPSTPDVVEYAYQPDNLLEGTGANENIASILGSDTIRGEGGDDVLNGGSGFFTEIYGTMRAANDNRADGVNGVF